MIECLYSDLKEGDLFSYNCKYVACFVGDKMKRIKGDKRIYLKEKDGGALQIVDARGYYIPNPTFKEWPFYSMKVFKVEVKI